MFTKLGRHEVLMVPYKCCCFRPDPSKGGSRAVPKWVTGGPLLQRTSASGWKAIATNQIHSNDLEACGMLYCYFWFHSKVKGVGMIRAIFGPIPEMSLLITVWWYITWINKLRRFKSILAFISILGLKRQKLNKNPRFLEIFNNFICNLSRNESLLPKYIWIHLYWNIVKLVSFLMSASLILGKNIIF